MGMMQHIYMLLVLSVSCNAAVEHRHLRGGYQRETDIALDNVFSLALRDENVTPDQTSRRIQTAPWNDVQSTYINDCTTYLLDPDITNDGIISQKEFANMLLHQCRLEEMCKKGPRRYKFEKLNLNLQLKFINGICYHDDRADKFNCIQKVRTCVFVREMLYDVIQFH